MQPWSCFQQLPYRMVWVCYSQPGCLKLMLLQFKLCNEADLDETCFTLYCTSGVCSGYKSRDLLFYADVYSHPHSGMCYFGWFAEPQEKLGTAKSQRKPNRKTLIL